ncbi:M20/M25/M40 family metallo-hydrolase [Fulvivirga sp. 29W222]|uniref:Carboxypeptidase Q n=1 Tax=Fulvivirga marina TaxID=2494733 RepID=A0A937FUY6_9BACT|nr:M28 family peptidase [Fulvivirga marina]MBL6444987.1 M20/M25/M40 family metallo-hydrolase [Fulvivirga marina]
MRRLYLLLFLGVIILFPFKVFSQSDGDMLKNIFDDALTNGHSYEMLDYLSNKIGGRLSGSPEAAAAVEWSRQKMTQLGFDTVFLQEVMVPHWVRGKKEVVRVINSERYGAFELAACALGNSVGTGDQGIVANILEVDGIEALKKLGKKNVEGKVVFFNRPMDPTHISTFEAYSGAVDQRVYGASEAASLGALAVVVRSMASNDDDIPHTGTLIYKDGVKQIPAFAISTNSANLLSKSIKSQAGLKLYIEAHCEMLPDVLSYNVIGEIRGLENPDEYIVVGGHLDSWDLGDGAHDDGAGCVQAIETLRILKNIGYRPKHSIRAVMFMNEENGLRGGLKYAQWVKENNERHHAAIESDRGGFTPKGFTMTGSEEAYNQLVGWKPLFEPYGIYDFGQSGGGADIGPLEEQGTALFGFLPDSQRYFNLHHTTADTFDKIDKRELELGAASMAALVYLIDKYGINGKN